MGAFPEKLVLDGDEPVLGAGTPGNAQIIADVSEQNSIDIFEETGADLVRFGPYKFFGNARPDFDGALDVFAFHQLFDSQSGDDVERLAGVVAFAMAGCASNQRIVISDAGLLRSLGNAIDVGTQSDDGFAFAPGSDPGRGDSGDTFVDFESFLFEHAGQVLGGLHLLKAQFRETKTMSLRTWACFLIPSTWPVRSAFSAASRGVSAVNTASAHSNNSASMRPER